MPTVSDCRTGRGGLISFSLHVRLTGHFGMFWGGRQVDNSSVWTADAWFRRDDKSSQALLRDASGRSDDVFVRSVWQAGGGPRSTIRRVRELVSRSRILIATDMPELTRR